MACEYAVDHIDNCRCGLRFQLGEALVREDIWIFVWKGLGMVNLYPLVGIGAWSWGVWEGRVKGSQRRLCALARRGN
jgi:hypothetical protein